MLFSVIVPVYNISKWIVPCAESLINQTFKDYEVLLIDDGSTDESGKICDEYSNRYSFVRTFHKDNGGLVSARKYGASKAVGEYIVNVDGDDFVAPDFLSLIYANITKHKSDCISFGYIKVDEFGNEISANPNLASEGYYEKNNLNSLMHSWLYDFEVGGRNYGKLSYGVCLKAVKRDKYINAQNDVDTSINTGEDVLFTAALFNNVSSISVINCTPYRYRFLRNSMVRSVNSESFINLDKVVKYLKQYNCYGGNRKQINYYCFYAFWQLIVLFGKSKGSYSDFKKIISSANLYELESEIKNIKYRESKDIIKLILLKNRLYFVIFYLYKIFK